MVPGGEVSSISLILLAPLNVSKVATFQTHLQNTFLCQSSSFSIRKGIRVALTFLYKELSISV
jgi:hypothetical protein